MIRGFDAIAETVSGNATTAATLLFGAVPKPRTHIQLTNNGGVDLWLATLNRGDAAPTITLANKNGRILPGETAILPYGSGLAIYVQAASGTCAYAACGLLAQEIC